MPSGPGPCARVAFMRLRFPRAISFGDGHSGTEFIVAYNAKSQLSEVLCLGGTVAVHSPRDRKNHGVLMINVSLQGAQAGVEGVGELLKIGRFEQRDTVVVQRWRLRPPRRARSFQFLSSRRHSTTR